MPHTAQFPQPPLAFWPFVCAPTAQHQMQMVLGPLAHTEREQTFLNMLFQDVQGRPPGDAVIRIIEFDGEVIFASIFLTDAIEARTERTGLMIAAGFAITDHAFLANTRLPSQINSIVFDSINHAFGTQLPRNGAAQLIGRIVSGDASVELRNIEQELARIARVTSELQPPSLGPIGRVWRRLTWRSRSDFRPPPKCILLLADSRGDGMNAAFDSLVHERVVRSGSLDDIANVAGDHVSGEVVIRYLGLGTPSITSAEIVRGPTVSYVALY